MPKGNPCEAMERELRDGTGEGVHNVEEVRQRRKSLELQETLKKLQLKAGQYRQRIEDPKFYMSHKDAKHKLAIIGLVSVSEERLMDARYWFSGDLEKDVREKMGQDFDYMAFKEALSVINDYVRNDGRKTRSGEGWQDLESTAE